MRNGKVALSVLEEKSRASPWDSEKNGFKVEGGTTCTDPSSPMTCHPDDASYTAVAINGASKRPLASMLTAAKGIWQAYPSPDSAHVAWVFSGKEDLGSDQSQDIDEVWISGDGSFAVEILGLMDAKDTALPRVVKALTEAGFPPAKTGKAVKPRKASVVYTAKGAEAKAKAVAAAIPGGATVEPLTWKSDCDVVVAVGDSAK
jgi:hypothetical protein